jgi:2-oxoglutarate dehydrogenase E2 component (dihydrolipoamide succinyltransferase)
VQALGESIVEATVGRWLKQVGEPVAVGDPLVELETEKVNMEVAANTAGVLESIARQEGETVNIGDVLGVIGEGGGATTQPEKAATGAKASAATTSATTSTDAATSKTPAATTNAVSGEAANATPVARRMAAEHGVDLQRISGTGLRGQITQDDVTAYLNTLSTHKGNGNGAQSTTTTAVQSPPAVPAAPTAPIASATPLPRTGEGPGVGASGDRREERVRMSRRRQTIARRLVEAQQTAAMLTTFNEVDMSAVMDLRKRYRDTFKQRYGVGLGFMSFFTRAVIGALKAFPHLNAEIQGDEMVLKHYYDIGIAVGVDEGLVVPVLRDADKLSFAEIERQIADMATRARNNTLTLEELRGGTFTITNGGTFGSLLSTPILNAPQVGILGMHKIEERPIALNGQVVIHPMMYLALSYDHRIVDGSEAVRFLVHVKGLIEDPGAMLLEE